MTLAEAIRLGASLRPACRGAFYDRLPSGEIGSCVLGAAYEGMTGRSNVPGSLIVRFLEAEFPAATQLVGCPVCLRVGRRNVGTRLAIAMHLHDDHELSRELVADWIQQLDELQEVA